MDQGRAESRRVRRARRSLHASLSWRVVAGVGARAFAAWVAVEWIRL
ncbi:hypothetical protein AWB77_01856 [Caballeronia fortuita]|uniref:Uncharacterized protein n=1 Tax=Caballeronia fortuita TaxID=1777138 RepID=A0A158AL25_9BURK|nr:hypothetical protein AWB77_01856 [Caballeronia fortuita]